MFDTFRTDRWGLNDARDFAGTPFFARVAAGNKKSGDYDFLPIFKSYNEKHYPSFVAHRILRRALQRII